MLHLITIQQAINNFKKLIENAILKDGVSGKEAMIRSSKPIMNIHEAVKSELIHHKIRQERIFPSLGETTPELRLAGFLKKKAQDICIIPEKEKKYHETLTDGLLQGAQDSFGKTYTEQTLSINVRSQISSLAKNFDTLYERTIAEAYNLHIRCPEMCLGEVYLIAIPEYDSELVKQKQIGFVTPKSSMVEQYIKSFQAINGRIDTNKEKYKYEKICLLIVNFNQRLPKIYHCVEELKKDQMLQRDSKLSITALTWKSFIPSLLKIYDSRFK